MPSAYTGSRTGVQAPAAAPAPDNHIIVNVPVDGDPKAASTFAQGFKVLSDYVDYLHHPQSAVGERYVNLREYKNGSGTTRALVDAFGFPGGRFIQCREDFATDAALDASNTPAYVATEQVGISPSGYMPLPGWKWCARKTGSPAGNYAEFRDPGWTTYGPPAARSLVLSAPTGAIGDLVTVARLGSAKWTTSTYASLEFDLRVHATIARASFCAGLCMFTNAGGYSTPYGVGGLYFMFDPAAGTWKGVLSYGDGVGGAAVTLPLTPISPSSHDNPYRLRVVHDGASGAFFSVNGVHALSIAGSINTSITLAPWFQSERTDLSSATSTSDMLEISNVVYTTARV